MGTLIQLILSLFGAGMKDKVIDVITNVLLKGQGTGGATTADANQTGAGIPSKT